MNKVKFLNGPKEDQTGETIKVEGDRIIVSLTTSTGFYSLCYDLIEQDGKLVAVLPDSDVKYYGGYCAGLRLALSDDFNKEELQEILDSVTPDFVKKAKGN